MNDANLTYITRVHHHQYSFCKVPVLELRFLFFFFLGNIIIMDSSAEVDNSHSGSRAHLSGKAKRPRSSTVAEVS